MFHESDVEFLYFFIKKETVSGCPKGIKGLHTVTQPNRWTRLRFRWSGKGLYNRGLRAQEDHLVLPTEIPRRAAIKFTESSGQEQSYLYWVSKCRIAYVIKVIFLWWKNELFISSVCALAISLAHQFHDSLFSLLVINLCMSCSNF